MTRMGKVSAGLVILAVVAATWPHRLIAESAAQAETATVAAVVGGAELQRAGGGEWQLAVVGSTLFVGDRVRTRPTSHLKLVFQDDSVVDIGPATEFLIESQTFNASARQYRSALKLITGKIRARVSDYYSAPNARYEIETPTAVAGISGTEFVVVYDAQAEYTDIVGIDGEVQIEGTLGVIGGGVRVGPQTASRVQKGRFPSAPRRIDDTLFHQYLEGLDIVGTGGRDSLGSAHPAVKGALLSPADSAEQVGGVPSARTEARSAKPGAGLVVGAPDEPVASRLSRDVATNTQPLLEYRITPPGQPPTGAVRVGF
jgi:hypothetical protein